ncbi:preprotein translocase subunit SecA [Peribacillus simplex]|uniref:Protein translocase subunit SecA n=2 Tax=Peribacillus TaxID=2675229 RepID=A0AA90NXV5_9BACI|nr:MULTISPECIES: preprotein translocase subunit SecA [Peribacillus]MDP1416844.1 preprotein translocase subunit SecA [Peribacillus simplex]MDP1449499.1 preprotein translocase subunit SecA [Peribacillus frigoritolerans]
MLSSMKKFFQEGSKDLKRIYKFVEDVNRLEGKYERYSDLELSGMKDRFKSVLDAGDILDIQAEAFAVVREASKRVLNLRHHDVQLAGGFVLSERGIAQMNTGEGKTLVSTLPSYLHALYGNGVHIITANEYLARRDKELMGQIHEFLGLTVGLNISQMGPSAKREAYAADITYGTATEFGFDYLRDNMVYRREEKVQRGHRFAIVDEIDSILIDEARTPLIIAGRASDGTELHQITAQIMKTFIENDDYEIFIESRSAYFTDQGASKIEEAFGIDNLYGMEHQELLHNVTQALKAHAIMKLDVDYIVIDGKIAIIDKFTGRVMEGRSFSDGLHQAIEAKEGLEISEENETQAMITVQNYFRLYHTMSGMTGSAMPSKSEFQEIYQLPVIEIPTNEPIIRVDEVDLIYKDETSKINKIVTEVKRIHDGGRPILIGTTSIEQSEKISVQLEKGKIKHQILNAKTEEDEAEIIANAGQKNQVMLATNMAGRGTDIILGNDVKELGGLHIIGTERHESRRIDMQLRGRSGRQGDPGSTQFIISLEDDLFDYYDEDEIGRYIKKIKTDENGLVLSPAPDKFVKMVQETVEQMHQSSRYHLLKLEHALNEQCKIIYTMRDRILGMEPGRMSAILLEYIEKYITRLVKYYPEPDSSAFIEELSPVFLSLGWQASDLQDLEGQIEGKALDALGELESRLVIFQDDAEWGNQVRAFMLQHIDTNWMNHLDEMNSVKEGIGLSGYGQQDPYALFEKAALSQFNLLLSKIESEISIRFMEYMESNQEDAAALEGEER